MSGVLYVVATPIGNLGDITARAVDTLRAADRIVAEDTRRTRALLTHLGISGKPVDRLDANASEADVARVVERLAQGERVALCTDAGTPVVSDPGTELVRAAARAGMAVIPIPGASAVIAAVSASGLVDGGFRFMGFLPREGALRREALQRVKDTPEAVVFFEAPQRCAATLVEVAALMPDRSAVVCRELTKLHEELVRGRLAELAAAAVGREWLGEITIVLGPAELAAPRAWSAEELDRRIDEGLVAGRRAKDIADELAFEAELPRRDVYARVVARRRH